MKKEEIDLIIIDSIKEILGNPNISPEPNQRLIEDLGLESIDLVDLIFTVEKKIGSNIDFADFSREMMRYNVGRYLELKISDLSTYIVGKKNFS